MSVPQYILKNDFQIVCIKQVNHMKKDVLIYMDLQYEYTNVMWSTARFS